jgi:diguanylate cyclase (GGDEF)-like protein
VNPPSNSTAAASRVRPGPDEDAAPSRKAPPSLVDSYRRLADVFHDVLSEQDLDALLERIADTVQELIPCDGITVYEADESRRELKAVFANGREADEVLADDPFAYGEGLTGWAVEHLEPVLANRAELDPRVRWVDNTEREPESLIVVPLIARQGLKGTLNLYRDGLQEFTEVEYTLAKRFGDAAALAIDNAHIRAGLELQAQTDPLTGLWNHRAFHELLREELVRASAAHGSVALVMLDLDDFKRVNDVYGHATGDHLLGEVAAILRGSVRATDEVCRIGGEEFAIIVPTADRETATHLADRVVQRIASTDFDPVGPLRLSVGVALGPAHAANPRELVACADMAMLTAKAQGKGRVVVFDEATAAQPEADEGERRREFRSIAHLKLLHGASAKLSRLNDTAEIGATIANELRRLIDYHNCRVFVREGDELQPIAFVGDLSSHPGSALELLATRVGVGVTGHVAETGEPLIIGDAANCDIGVQVEGTETIEESLLAVPLRFGAQVVGVIVVSKLGLDQFDADDLRLLEVLAGHASVAVVNARLYESQRREADMAKALLELSRELSATTELDEVLARVARGTARILGTRKASLWLPEGEAGDLVCRAVWTAEGFESAVKPGATIPRPVTQGIQQLREPFVVEGDDYLERTPRALHDAGTEAVAVAPIVIDNAWGALAVTLTDRERFDERQLGLLGGIASQAKLAITNAQSFHSLERTFLSTVEALANALEAKDEYTSSHTRWITDTALRVASELGLDPASLKRVELAALFHDIGKIGIPASILTKPGPLTDDELALIRKHPELGERILAPIVQLEDVRPIVRACHERFDGKGYPDGLRGEAIPLEARIIFACDAFHAMTTNRPYRQALPAEEARRRLREAAGTQFDPRVVDVCLEILEAPEG